MFFFEKNNVIQKFNLWGFETFMYSHISIRYIVSKMTFSKHLD